MYAGVIILNLQKDRSMQTLQTHIRVFTVCNSICIFFIVDWDLKPQSKQKSFISSTLLWIAFVQAFRATPTHCFGFNEFKICSLLKHVPLLDLRPTEDITGQESVLSQSAEFSKSEEWSRSAEFSESPLLRSYDGTREGLSSSPKTALKRMRDK